MFTGKFYDLTPDQQQQEVRARYQHRPGSGWFTAEGMFVGSTEEDVIAALIDFEEAEINAVGDCMTGFCMVAPKLEDFVRKPGK